MDNLTRTMHELPELDFPDGLHGRIMRQIIILRFRTPFLTVLGLALLNLLATGYSIWVRMVEIDGLELLHSLLAGLQFDLDSIGDVAGLSLDLFPVRAMAAFTVNLIMVGYLIYLHFTFKRMSIIPKGRTPS